MRDGILVAEGGAGGVAAGAGARGVHIAGIGGLRAIAVLAVVAFHLDPRWLPGGFVGVDVFFVISGFVVAHSVAGVRAERFGAYCAGFYRRRCLRILPALYVYVLVVALVGGLLMPGGEGTRPVALTGAAAVFGLSNLALLWKAGDYFATASAYNGFTQTWSLGVEEQYYLLFPAAAWWLRGRARWAPVGVVALACLLSLAAAGWLTQAWRAGAFFLLPARLWELGIGALLRWLGAGLAVRGGALWAAGALAALAASFVVTREDAFPWPGALLPCLATLVLLAVLWRGGGGWPARMLGARAPEAIGAISYSLYLWHWGVVVLMRWTLGLDTLALKALAVALMAALAVASHRWVERPLRHHRRLLALPAPVFFAGVAGVAGAVAAVCLGLAYAKPRIGLAASNAAAVWDPAFVPVEGTCPVARRTTDVGIGWRIADRPACAAADARRLFVVGDSHAGAYALLLHTVAHARAMPVDLYTAGGCRVIDIDDSALPPGCAAFRARALAEVRAAARPGDVVFLPGLYTPLYRKLWDADVPRDAGLGAQRPLDRARIAASEARLRALIARGVTIIVEAPKPVMPSALFRCADGFNRGSGYCRPGWHVPRAEAERRRARARAALVAITRALPGARLWDPLPLLCDARACDGYRDGAPLYYDTHHLSAAGNRLLVPGFLGVLDR
ncbi:acyltransferase family protein [Sphingomonas sp. NFR15]|uniref:acyltransferase family protein n=1 Tax=Sphingomonas sp. NFR15 TaxID=1566282 RepID=UPI000881CAA3|nr:acyltransferase family protein [Sphingomonas sp. NFR15]SDA36720.1 Peptidoglycan/LPS O-acetylase OafA/YrhL, contains acyltransferase and SGNH-hydrolase domains [Sphingomonas sp. NFR15]